MNKYLIHIDFVESPISEPEHSCLIVGCGYVGFPLARSLQAKGCKVAGVVRSEESRQRLKQAGVEAFAGDIGHSEFLRRLPLDWNHLVYCPSTGGRGLEGYQHIHGAALERVLEKVGRQTRFHYTSSTSVYGQQDGEWVDEESVLEPAAPTARILVAAEKRVVQAGGTVLRLGGIYGPGRGVLLSRLEDGRAMIPLQDPKWLNLIHLDDIVFAIRHSLNGQLAAGEIYNVIDDEPASYRDIYTWLCGRLERDLPPVGDPEYQGKRGRNNKRVSNRKLKATGWVPAFPSFREGYQAMLADGF